MRRVADRVVTCGLVALAVATVCSCGPALHVETDFDRKASFRDYHAWAFIDNARARGGTIGGLDATLRGRIEDAIGGELKSHGFKSAGAATPDFYVAYHGGAADRIAIETYGYSGRWASNGGEPVLFGGSPKAYTEGTMVLDIVDAKSRELVWRSQATDVVGDRTDAAGKAAKAVRRMLESFPPHG